MLSGDGLTFLSRFEYALTAQGVSWATELSPSIREGDVDLDGVNDSDVIAWERIQDVLSVIPPTVLHPWRTPPVYEVR